VLCWLIDDDRRYVLYQRALSESERRAKPSCGAVL
jgi:hypothetical protein